MNKIFLNARIDSSLEWQEEINEAEKMEGKIHWEIDLGLFDFLKKPLEDRTQFLALQLALEHFRDTVWADFKEKTANVCIYRGSLPFPGSSCIDFLAELAEIFPESCPVCVYLDASAVENRAMLVPMLNREKFGRLKIKGKGLLHKESAACGICQGGSYEGLDQLLAELKEPFRLIPEERLTSEWNGLDRLFVFSKGVSEMGRRKLLGFCAAGGEVVTVGEPLLGLPQEISFAEWVERG